jgi:hypothetical protein
MGPLASANHEIREAERNSIEQRLARLTEPHRLTDNLLFQLEELNLDGVRSVPENYEPLLADLRQQLESRAGVNNGLIERLRTGQTTSDLIEAIFMVQEVIAPPLLPADAFPFDDAEIT